MPAESPFLLAAAAALVAAAPAHAVIVPGRSMAGVRLGMSQERVLQILGDPDTDFTYRSGLTTYAYKSRRLRVTFSPGRTTNNVFMLFTSGRGNFRDGRFCLLGGGEGTKPDTPFKINRRHRVASVRILQNAF